MLLNKEDQISKPRHLLIPVALVVVLLLTAALSVAALFIKYRIDHARSISAHALQERIGVDFGFDGLHTEGVRSLRVEGLHFNMPVPGIGNVSLTADSLKLAISIADIFKGYSAVGMIEVNGARILIESDKADNNKKEVGLAKKEFSIDPLVAKIPPIDIRGDNCSVVYKGKPDKLPLRIENIAFLLSKAAESSEVALSLSAAMPAGESESIIKVEAVYRAPDTIDAILELDSITPAHLEPFVAIPAETKGELAVRAHAYGVVNRQIATEIALDVNNLSVPQLPEELSFLDISSARLNSEMELDIATRQLYLFQTTLAMDILNANVQGSINFMQQPAVLNIDAHVDDIPLNRIVSEVAGAKAAQFGEYAVDISPDSDVSIRLRGTLQKPAVEVHASIPEVSASVRPTDKKLPKGNLKIQQVNVCWSDFAKLPAGTANLVDGEIIADEFGIKADKLAGMISFDGETVKLHPLMASISEKPWSGTVSYKLADRQMAFDVNGALTKIEETPLYDLVNKLWLGGDIAVRGQGTLGLDGHLKLKANADVTKGMVAFEWWLRKPVGVGASIHNIEVDLIPRKTLTVQGEAAIEDTRILAKLDYVYAEGKFQQKHIRVDVPHLEVNSAGKCVQIPYTARGEACHDAYYESNLVGGKFGDDIAKIGGHFDYVSFLPNNGANPLICKDADVLVTLTDIKGGERSAALEVHAGEAHVPPFGDDWLLPLGPSDEYESAVQEREVKAKNPKTPEPPQPPQPWTYTLSADKIYVPPWEGDNFEAEVYSNDKETGFKFFRANCGKGRLEGTYLHEKQDNIMHLDATWDSIPATFLIRHLELPEVLEGDITGNMNYVVDRDDPRTTMRADGKFSVANGRFIPEQLAFMLADTLGSSFIALHPDALAFKTVSSDVNIEGDKINTKNLVIDSEGMRISGDGVWVMEGDLDYNITVAITPDLAEQIPLLMDYFNVQGFRMTQQNIELGFHLTGPTFSPSGQLAGLPPIGVTIVSGAAEMTGEAIKLLDTPRQMFMSIFRIGGGILGATRTQQQQPPQQK